MISHDRVHMQLSCLLDHHVKNLTSYSLCTEYLMPHVRLSVHLGDI